MATEVASFLLTRVEHAIGVDGRERKVVEADSRPHESAQESEAGNPEKDDGSGLLSFALIEMIVQGEGGGGRLGRLGMLRKKIKGVKKDTERINTL